MNAGHCGVHSRTSATQNSPDSTLCGCLSSYPFKYRSVEAFVTQGEVGSKPLLSALGTFGDALSRCLTRDVPRCGPRCRSARRRLSGLSGHLTRDLLPDRPQEGSFDTSLGRDEAQDAADGDRPGVLSTVRLSFAGDLPSVFFVYTSGNQL